MTDPEVILTRLKGRILSLSEASVLAAEIDRLRAQVAKTELSRDQNHSAYMTQRTNVETAQGDLDDALKSLAARDERIAGLEAAFPSPTNILEYGPKTASLSLTFRNEADRARAVAFIRSAAKAALDGEKS